MAKGIYNSLTNSNNADGAGLTVDKDGQLLEERAKEQGSDVGKVIEVMSELGIDVSDSPRTQLREDLLSDYDKVVVILEPSKVPTSLKDKPNVEIWDIEDPKVKDLDGVRETRDIIAESVKALIAGMETI